MGRATLSLIEETEILIIVKKFLSIIARTLLAVSDYVLVDGVSLIAQILVREERCTCKYIELTHRQITCLTLRSLLENNIIELVNKLESHVTR